VSPGVRYKYQNRASRLSKSQMADGVPIIRLIELLLCGRARYLTVCTLTGVSASTLGPSEPLKHAQSDDTHHHILQLTRTRP